MSVTIPGLATLIESFRIFYEKNPKKMIENREYQKVLPYMLLLLEQIKPILEAIQTIFNTFLFTASLVVVDGYIYFCVDSSLNINLVGTIRMGESDDGFFVIDRLTIASDPPVWDNLFKS